MAVLGFRPDFAPGTRMHVQTPAIESGQLLLPEQAPWLDAYVRELTGFPGTKYDDQVDATSQLLDYMVNGPGANLLIWERWAQVKATPYYTHSPLG